MHGLGNVFSWMVEARRPFSPYCGAEVLEAYTSRVVEARRPCNRDCRAELLSACMIIGIWFPRLLKPAGLSLMVFRGARGMHDQSQIDS